MASETREAKVRRDAKVLYDAAVTVYGLLNLVGEPDATREKIRDVLWGLRSRGVLAVEDEDVGEVVRVACEPFGQTAADLAAFNAAVPAADDEWETTNERTVKWDKEQTAYLRQKLGSCGYAEATTVPTGSVEGIGMSAGIQEGFFRYDDVSAAVPAYSVRRRAESLKQEALTLEGAAAKKLEEVAVTYGGKVAWGPSSYSRVDVGVPPAPMPTAGDKPAESPAPLVPGSVCRLKSGGPRMTVVGFGPGGDVCVAWFNGVSGVGVWDHKYDVTAVCRGTFPLACLTPA